MRRPPPSLAAALLAALAPGLALAQQPAQQCWVPYAAFEEHVRHMDLDRCPGDNPRPERGFCRAALEGGDLVIYVFEHNDPAGGPCLVRVQRQDFNSFAALNSATYVRP